MKKNLHFTIFLFSILTLMIWGCSSSSYSYSSSSGYQVHEIKCLNSSNDTIMEFKDEKISLNYSFWSSNGESNCIIENLTDSLMFIDLELSHFIYNTFAQSYYNNTTTIQNTTITNAPNVNTSGLSHGVSNATGPVKLIILPPHSRKLLPSFSIGRLYKSCDLNSESRNTKLTFTYNQSPIKFTNLLFYRIGESSMLKSIKNDFYIASITDIPNYKFFKQRAEEICGRKTGFYKNYSPFQSDNRYYIKF